ncbi:MAG: bifunctional diaminohydroxyphosphoribosylaminopyrimidine deaminase/5-amino-6-(5-phosphoribosylamino)uracil reductase RibD [Proteobacteria bacterium]|nr:bifunctional diaminohydroxyphosphoribosylaminopyrimidine deaminase/5-amino-6-(5-phosphoribosylamino)uracil reductase RibD [Pseudomonadota bacterium]
MTATAARDRVHMERALALAETYRGRTSPNPIVGCVIVDAAGAVIAEGVHRGPGTDHAEVDALKQAGDRAQGATLYVNLEPCNHHGRTPPCAPVVRDARVARVVIGIADPIASHAGGIAVLHAAGIAVDEGVLGDACEAANRPFFTWARHRRPAITLKAAITLDGKIATVGGESKWITGEAARADVMQLRATHDAVMVGIGTVLADDPRLTVRQLEARDPIRIVVDAHLRTPANAAVLAGGARTIIATARPGDLEGAEVWELPARDGRVDLHALAHRLASENVTSVLCEGGGELHASLLAAELADELYLYVAPTIVGGPAKSWVGGGGVAALASAYRATFDGAPVMFGGDVRLHAILAPRRHP